MIVHRTLCAFALCSIPAGGLAQTHELDRRTVDPLAGTSECARTCFTKTNDTEAFEGSQTDDLCQDKPLYHNIEICVKHDCNFTEILDFKNRTSRSCDWPVTDHRQAIRITCLTIGILAMVFFTMRAVSKIFGFVPYGHDDSLILAALPFIIAFNIFCQILTLKGLGLDIWLVEEDDIRTFLILIFASELSYATALALVKLSILAFFLRIFPDQRFRTVVRWTTIFILVISPIYLALIFAQRRPLDILWNGWRDKNPRGVILSANLIGITHGAWNVALDDDSSNDSTTENWDQAKKEDWCNCYVWSGPIPHDRQFRSYPKPDSIFNVTEHNCRFSRNNNLVKYRDLRRHDGGMHAWSTPIRARHNPSSETKDRA